MSLRDPPLNPAQVVLDVKAPKQVTLRLLTPEHYRAFVKTDTPVSVISEWAQIVAEPVAEPDWEQAWLEHSKDFNGSLEAGLVDNAWPFLSDTAEMGEPNPSI